MKLIAPASLDQALAIRAETGARPFAGGTDLYPERATRRAWGGRGEEVWLDLSRLSELRGVSREGDVWRFGCMTTWTDLIRADLPAQFDGWRAAAREIGGAQIQNRGTLVGNLCTASPAGDGLPCLLSLDAVVELRSATGTRRVPVRDFLLGRRRVDCRPDEIVAALLVPARDRARGAFRKFGARRYLVISIAMAAALIETAASGRVTCARVAVGACSETAQRLLALEAALSGEIFTPSLAEHVLDVHVQHLSPIDDVRASAYFRREAAKEIVRELLISLAAPPQAEAA